MPMQPLERTLGTVPKQGRWVGDRWQSQHLCSAYLSFWTRGAERMHLDSKSSVLFGLTLTCTHCSGLDTMRWQSRNALVCLRRLATTGAPMVRLGTKWPSCGGGAGRVASQWVGQSGG